jgi:hypothetical protein
VIARSSALLGVGYGALSMALVGLTAIGSEPEPAATMGTISFDLSEGAAAELEIIERPIQWSQSLP